MSELSPVIPPDPHPPTPSGQHRPIDPATGRPVERRADPPQHGTKVHTALAATAATTAATVAAATSKAVTESTVAVADKLKLWKNVSAFAILLALFWMGSRYLLEEVRENRRFQREQAAEQWQRDAERVRREEAREETRMRREDDKWAATLARMDTSHELVRSAISESRAVATEGRTVVAYVKKMMAEIEALKKLLGGKGKGDNDPPESKWWDMLMPTLPPGGGVDLAPMPREKPRVSAAGTP